MSSFLLGYGFFCVVILAFILGARGNLKNRRFLGLTTVMLMWVFHGQLTNFFLALHLNETGLALGFFLALVCVAGVGGFLILFFDERATKMRVDTMAIRRNRSQRLSGRSE